MKVTKAYLFGLSCLVVLTQLFGLVNPPKADAVTGSDWNASRIIDDSVFFNPHAMSTQEIQNFLAAKVPTCDTNHAPSSNPNDSGPPYTCLKDFTQNIPGIGSDTYCPGSVGAGVKSAATIIKEVSAACNINPQVILVTLQKEQGLITDTWPWQIQYTKATGMGCPDSALGTNVDANQNGCYDEYEGFFKQIYYGARQFQRYVKQPDTFNYAVGRNSFVAYQANNSGCGGTNITPQTQATAALYNYTPYQPNQAALNNLYGTGDSCSAYGNRNFWRMFWDWFGNPIGSRYAWLIDSFTYSGGDNLLAQGSPETLTLKARNVGRIPWYNHGANPVRLGTWLPNRSSGLINGGARFATLQESVVQPNGVGTFTFQVTPQSLGTFVEGMNLVAENSEWMSWPGFSPTITVASPYQWQIEDVTYDKGTGVMAPGSQQLISVRARNTGNVTWNKFSGGPVRLGTWEPQRQSAVSATWLSPTRVAEMNENSVAPGQVAGFQFYVTMPSSGNFYERLNLVSEGQAWFNNPGLTLYLHGLTYAWQPVWHTLSTTSANIPRNTDFVVTFKAKNTGEMPWKKATDTFPIRLATTGPQDRGSALYHNSWISQTRLAALQEGTVMPGETGTFVFNARTPATPGERFERFSLIAEGVAWFNDPGYLIYINVL